MNTEVQPSSAATETEVFNRLVTASAAAPETPTAPPPAAPEPPAKTETEAPTAPPPAAETPATPPAAEQLYKIRLRGKDVEVPMNELVALGQMGADYTMKTQELARARRQLAAERAEMERMRQASPAPPSSPPPAEDDLDPDLAQSIQRRIVEPRLAEMAKKVEDLQRTIQSLQVSREDEGLRATVATAVQQIQRQYPEVDAERVLGLAANRVDPDADGEEVSNAILETARDEAQYLKAHRQRAVDDAFKNKATAPAQAGGGAPATPAPPKVGDSREEIEDHVTRRLKAAAAMR